MKNTNSITNTLTNSITNIIKNTERVTVRSDGCEGLFQHQIKESSIKSNGQGGKNGKNGKNWKNWKNGKNLKNDLRFRIHHCLLYNHKLSRILPLE